MDLGFSKTLAIVFGTALPLLGFVRMLTASDSDPMGFFADLIAGAFLLIGAWRVGEVPHSGQRFLAAAWGLSIGLLYSSLYAQIQTMRSPSIVESPISPEWVIPGIVLTALGLFVAIVGLITCLRSVRKH